MICSSPFATARMYASPYASLQRPIAIFGQNAKAEGTTKWVKQSHRQAGKVVVGPNFVEQLFQYCADERFRDDTGFFILEQDFRFYASDCTAVQRLTAKKLRQKFPPGSVQPRGRLESHAEEATPELRDLLRYVTAARRWHTERCPHGHHNLIWMSWEPHLSRSDTGHYHWPPHPGEDRQHVPGTGNYMWFLTARGARHIKMNVLAPPACLQARLPSCRSCIPSRCAGACSPAQTVRRESGVETLSPPLMVAEYRAPHNPSMHAFARTLHAQKEIRIGFPWQPST